VECEKSAVFKVARAQTILGRAEIEIGFPKAAAATTPVGSNEMPLQLSERTQRGRLQLQGRRSVAKACASAVGVAKDAACRVFLICSSFNMTGSLPTPRIALPGFKYAIRQISGPALNSDSGSELRCR
jgi:hypothetical protein